MIKANETEERFQLRMPSTLANIDEADDKIASFLKARQLAVDQFAVRILLREALLNAVVHGGGKDPAKLVHMSIEIDDRGVTIVVEDPGTGFAWCNRSKHHEVLADGGRGLPIMELYSDEMSFNESGNRLTMRKEFNKQVENLQDRKLKTSEA